MQFPIATAGLLCMVAEPPAQRVDFETKAPKTAEDGRPVFSAKLLIMDGRESAPVRVTVHGDPGVAFGQPVRAHGLAINVMDRKGESMSWWTCERLEPLGPPLVSADEGEEPGSDGGPTSAPVAGRRGTKGTE